MQRNPFIWLGLFVLCMVAFSGQGFLVPASGQAMAPPLPGAVLLPAADADVYAYTYRNWNNSNVGRNATLTCGYHPTGGERRIFMRFELAMLGEVDSAVLRLYHYHSGGGNALRLGLFFVTSPWQEGTGTYHSGEVEPSAAPGEISWSNQPQIRQEPSVIFTMPATPNSFVDVDMTDMVHIWQGGAPNFGFVIKPVDPLSPAVGESVYGFLSREHEEVDRRPALIVNGGDNTTPPPPPPDGEIIKLQSLKLFDAVPNQSSDSFRNNTVPELRMQTTQWDATPYHMQTRYTGMLTIAAGQQVFLSSMADEHQNIAMDNFLLFEIECQGVEYRFVIGQNEPVYHEDSPVPQVLPTGYAFSADTDLSGLFPQGRPFNLTVSALDYGGRAELSDVYLLLE